MLQRFGSARRYDSPKTVVQNLNTSRKKPKIAILYAAFMSGGAEAVCLWMIEALKKDFDLHLITFTAVDWEKTNRIYGTHLSNESVKTITALPHFLTPLITYFLGNLSPLYPWRQHLLMRFFKKRYKQYDLAISAYNEMDLNNPGIQYIHAPGFALGRRRQERVSGFNVQNMRQNLTLTCSAFVAKNVYELHGIKAQVVFPPVPSKYPLVNWETKDYSFICCGRIHPDKEQHRAIDVLKAVRNQGYPVQLHIVGTNTNKDYLARLEALREDNHDWVHLHVGRTRDDYVKLLTQSKFAIHFRIEGFGITIAELLKVSCIPFVYEVGGQREVIGSEEALMFKNDEEACQKIVAVLKDETTQTSLRQGLLKQASAFSAETFVDQIREHVSNCLKKKNLSF